jgi:hypothetical protein
MGRVFGVEDFEADLGLVVFMVVECLFPGSGPGPSVDHLF